MKWKGAPELRDFLLPVGSLRVHPDNPRDHDLDAITGSLRRFGQLKPVVFALTDPEERDEEPALIVAGNGTYTSATEKLGWTHIAAVGNVMDEDEALAYLLADNRTSDKAEYHDETLQRLLGRLNGKSALRGTGYKASDVRKIAEDEAEKAKAVLAKVPKTKVAAKIEARTTSPILLTYGHDDRARVVNYLRMLRKETGKSDEEIVLWLLDQGAKAL